jgi:hypothetical protein
MSATPPKRPKQPYAAPKLVTYGDVTTLTGSRRGGPNKDGGKGAKARTR